MQVDEERKGAQASADLDVGCYENDSEDEREIKEQEESQKTVLFKLNAAGTANVTQVGINDCTLIVCACITSQSLVKIMYAADWQEVGEATSTKDSATDKTAAADKGPKSLLKLYALNGAKPFYFALPDLENMSGSSINQVVGQLFG